jgi:hypothetical protein
MVGRIIANPLTIRIGEKRALYCYLTIALALEVSAAPLINSWSNKLTPPLLYTVRDLVRRLARRECGCGRSHRCLDRTVLSGRHQRLDQSHPAPSARHFDRVLRQLWTDRSGRVPVRCRRTGSAILTSGAAAGYDRPVCDPDGALVPRPGAATKEGLDVFLVIIDTSSCIRNPKRPSPAPLAIQRETSQPDDGKRVIHRDERSLRILGLVFLLDADLFASRLFEVRLVGKELREHKRAESGIRLSRYETGLSARAIP